MRKLSESVRLFSHIDWFIAISALLIALLGLVTMRSFSPSNVFFDKQLIWICIAVGVFFIASLPEYTFLRRTSVVVGMYTTILFLLALIFSFAAVVKGAQNRFSLGLFAFQPSDPAKIILILLLSKYFARRHIEIAHIRHILISGVYTFVVFVLVFLQPDFGSAIIIFSIWFGLILVAGISWKHLSALLITGILVFTALWQWGLHDYQKQRVMTFLNPLTDIQGSGYNAYQSTVAVGSGELLGKGIGYGTQSKLQFLPEYQTDFIFAAYAEEWGFFGVVILFGLFSVIIIRTLMLASRAADNFETLVCAGVAIYLLAQFIVHVGMNIGMLPITGTTLPFMSYGGSHLVTEFAALGMIMGLRRHSRSMISARDETSLISGI
jgi:rod shape determining protein RodA